MMLLRYLSVCLLLIILSGCEDEGFQPPTCILEEIEFDSNNRYRFETISGGTIYRQIQEYVTNDRIETLASFQFQYFTDSLVILDQLNPGKYPYLRAKYEDDRLKEVVRHFPLSDVLVTHFFSYNEDHFRVDMYRLASTGDYSYVAYGIYYTDESGNITRQESYLSQIENPDSFVRSEDRYFLYDLAKSPLQGLFLPFFSSFSLPGPEFFSPNNIVADQIDNTRREFQYQYGANGSTLAQIGTSGAAIQYHYLNCN